MLDLKSMGYIGEKDTDEHGVCAVSPHFIYTVAIVCGINEVGYRYRYCYPTLLDAMSAFNDWDGCGHPPGNWIKRKGEGGDLPNPNGDA